MRSSHAAVNGLSVLRLVDGLKNGLHDDLELLYISSLKSFLRHHSPPYIIDESRYSQPQDHE